jgi:hypothetical protein
VDSTTFRSEPLGSSIDGFELWPVPEHDDRTAKRPRRFVANRRKVAAAKKVVWLGYTTTNATASSTAVDGVMAGVRDAGRRADRHHADPAPAITRPADGHHADNRPRSPARHEILPSDASLLLRVGRRVTLRDSLRTEAAPVLGGNA